VTFSLVPAFKVGLFAQFGEKPLADAFFVHRRKRLNTLFHYQLFGQITPRGASTYQPQHAINEQTIVPAVPTLSPFLLEISDSIRCHCPSVNARRIKIALSSCDLETHSRVGGKPSNVHTT
jgi:hypothetical protein